MRRLSTFGAVLALVIGLVVVTSADQKIRWRLRGASAGGGGEFTCTTTLSGGGSINAAVSSAASGVTICLNNGTWSYTGNSSKSSMVTIRPAAGQTNVAFSNLDVTSSQNLTFTGGSIGMAADGASGGSSGVGSSPRHIVFDHITFTDGVCLNVPDNANIDWTVSNSTFANISNAGCGNEGRLQINGRNTTHNVDQGIVISHNTFGPGGCTDGVQTTAGPQGITIQYNEFTGIKQGSCAPAHVDPIQPFATNGHIAVTGNYFHGNSTGLMDGDCSADNSTYTDNVWISDGEYPQQLLITSNNLTVDHNTIVNGQIRIGTGGNCSPGAVVMSMTNNITADGIDTSCPGCSVSLTNVTRTNNVSVIGGTATCSGTIVYTGGSAPSLWTGFTLDVTSGCRTASTTGGLIGARIASLPTPGPQ